MYKKLEDYKEHLIDLVEENSYIDPSIYAKKNIKRGLRNADQTGVLVGVTKIADVHGYRKEDGKKIPEIGKLFYRGISLEDLCRGYRSERRSGFEEVCFLLLFGKLPSYEELEEFLELININQKLPKFFIEDSILKTPSENIMNKLQSVLLSLYSYDKDPDSLDLSHQLEQAISIISKMPLLVAYSYMAKKYYFDRESLILHNALDARPFSENILHLTRNDGKFTKEEAQLLDICLIVHADHGGGNNSAFTTHVVSSTGTDFYSAISAAIGSLKGPRHGGANKKAYEMIEHIAENVDIENEKQIYDYLNKIFDKEAFDKSGLIYGMGHAVYTLSDPRTEILKENGREVAIAKGMYEKFHFIELIEKTSKQIFKERFGDDFKICANVDLYSGFIYKMLGLSEDLFTPIFTIARTAGWCAHRIEQIRDKKIMRPAYLTISEENEYVPLEKR
ncbi:MAG: citrate synthase [Peptoniphilaceae bacterium]|nr:citrate synthase [Peptoniphilaceae bacterium]MDD7383668.1 citrate synthase [Peptoniphilaceae bacterium]MDY3737839.1 citrate synthase [Peptoniphilaceae bacterium]